MSHATQRDGAQEIATFLASRDVDCPSCRFNLRGLTTNRCPECNTLLQLTLGRTHSLRRLRVWLLVAHAMLTACFGCASVDRARELRSLYRAGARSLSGHNLASAVEGLMYFAIVCVSIVALTTLARGWRHERSARVALVALLVPCFGMALTGLHYYLVDRYQLLPNIWYWP
jgi:hypothetical protein